MDDAMVAVARSIRIESEIARRGIKLAPGVAERCGPCPVCGGTDRFSINVNKQVWNCRICSTGGDVIALVQHIDGASFMEAVKTLAGPAPCLAAKRQPKAAPSAPAPKKIVVARFDYRDENGDLLFQVERVEYQNSDGTFVLGKDGKRKKDFPQRCPDPARPGEWIYNLGDTRRILYRLPELTEALAQDRTIVVIEGEAKADLLWSWNIPATCSPMGGKNWRPDLYAATLRGADVIILPDNDDLGGLYLNAVAVSLTEVGATVRVLNLPGLGPKGDVIDWQRAGGTREQLDALIKNEARPWAPRENIEVNRDAFDRNRLQSKEQETHDDGFVRGDGGQILKGNPDNIRHAIGLLGVKLRHNEFSAQTEVWNLPGFGPELTDAAAVRLRLLIHETFGFLPSLQLFEHVLIDVAHQNRFHPVRDYLDARTWDETPRIDNWLVTYGGAEDTPFNRAVGRIILIAAVRRVRRPGVKFDTMLVLESPTQGKNKSQAARLLATRDEWFTDNLPLGADPKVVVEQVRGIWIVEFPELAGIATREVEQIKAQLSRQIDKARPAYGRRREDVKRQFIAIATTNDEEYLKKDERRFWPVRIEKFDLAALGRDIEQLWAEAVKYEAEGESITLQEDLWPAAAEVRAARRFENPYQARLSAQFAGSVLVTAERVWEALSIPQDQRTKAGKEVGQAMREIGFVRDRAWSDDEREGIKLKRGDYFYERKG